MSSSQANLVRLPVELRQQIYREYFKADGGYVFNGESEKLTTASGHPIDLSLMYTCRFISNDTKGIPLALNNITFSTVYREDWRPLAGCFNFISIFHRLLEADLVVRLERFMTPEMYSHLALEFPSFDAQIKKVSRDREASIAESEPEETIRSGRWMGDAFGWNLNNSAEYFRGFGHIRGDASLRETWDGDICTIQGAMSCCLRLLAEKEPAEFAKLVYEALPSWVDRYPAREVLDLGFAPWAIPSPSDVKNATQRLEADSAWQRLEPWYYQASLSPNAPGPQSTRLASLKPEGTRCREKIRFSAAAIAIRFLGHLSASQRLQIRTITLHEDFPAVSTPSCHVHGLAPYFKENPRLRVERRVDLLRCIFEQTRLRGAQAAAWFLQDPASCDIGDLDGLDVEEITPVLTGWLRDTLAVTDVGIPAESFTFTLEGGDHADFCTGLFQQFVHRDIAWDKASKSCIDRSIIVHLQLPSGGLVDRCLEGAIELLKSQKHILRSDFNTGHPWDPKPLEEETNRQTTFQWYWAWLERDTIDTDLPPTRAYADLLADNYEIQTEDEYM
ncbi:hypothetical protein FZEAL_3718 [Fusarium zealandicum]|uniref:Uncharacterized protein n=1 Tax=Fusarium zealandicum TaxID=1053134 RepID=A0A8H4UN69_9HYPO|nr:hypothetical protein FZEAL_3718 [Fusarium zealandicum]